MLVNKWWSKLKALFDASPFNYQTQPEIDLTELQLHITQFVELLCQRTSQYESKRHGGYHSTGKENKGLREGLYMGKQAIVRVHSYPLKPLSIEQIRCEMFSYIQYLVKQIKIRMADNCAKSFLKDYQYGAQERVASYTQQHAFSELLPELIEQRRLFAEFETLHLLKIAKGHGVELEKEMEYLKALESNFSRHSILPLAPNLDLLIRHMLHRIHLACAPLNALPRNEGVYELAGLHGVRDFLYAELDLPNIPEIQQDIVQKALSVGRRDATNV